MPTSTDGPRLELRVVWVAGDDEPRDPQDQQMAAVAIELLRS